MNDDVSKQGYKSNSPYRNSPNLLINSPKGMITMNGVNKPLVVKDLQYGDTRLLQPNSGNHYFKGTKMLETPYNNANNKTIENMNYKVKPWTGSFNQEVREMKNGGFLFNFSNGNGKLLPFLKKQDGGMTELREDTLGKEFGGADDSVVEDTNFDSKMTNIMDNLDESAVPPSIKSELAFFKSNPEYQNKLTEDYIKKYIPSLYKYMNSSSKESSPNAPNSQPSTPGPSAVLSDFETRDDPKFQKGGYAGLVGFPNRFQEQNKVPTQKYETGTRIQYRSGGQIKEGVIKSYDAITDKINLY